jgi:hypothetical protein
VSEQKERPTRCTCGAYLVADALFCHRCGRPVFEEAAPDRDNEPDKESEETEVPEPQAVLELPSSKSNDSNFGADTPPSYQGAPAIYQGPPEPIDLRNRMAVRLCFFTAAMLFPLVMLPLPLALKSVMLAGGGFFAVWMYQRRTKSQLNYLNAFRLGWIAGLMLFLLVLGVYAITFAVISFSGGNLLSQLTEAMQASGAGNLPEDQLKLVQEVFADWTKLFVVLLIALFLVFLYFTALAGLGGAMAARFTNKKDAV